MDEQQSIPGGIPSVSSFIARSTDVFAAPGELFTEVAAAPVQTSSWLLPLALSIVLSLVFTYALYYNGNLRQQIYDMQTRGMQKAVEEGKMTQERFDQVKEGMESSGPGWFMLIGGGGAIVSILVMFFCATLVLWLAVKLAFKFTGSYKKVLEIFGLASIIGLLGSIVTLLMMNVFNSVHATPSGSLLIMESFDTDKMEHKLLASLNVFTLWQAGVLGMGIARVTGKPTGAGLGLVYGLWLAWAIAASFLGLAR